MYTNLSSIVLSLKIPDQTIIFFRLPNPVIELNLRPRPSRDLKHEISCLVTLYQDITHTHMWFLVFPNRREPERLFVCLSIALSLYLSVYLSACLSICLCFNQSVYLTVYLSAYISEVFYQSGYVTVCTKKGINPTPLKYQNVIFSTASPRNR